MEQWSILQTIASTQWLIQPHALDSPKKLKYCKNQHHLYGCQIVDILNSINVNFLQILCTTIWTMYTNMPRHKKVFWSSKKKSTKDKAILNHVEQNRVLDMAKFEINFLSNYNQFFLQTSMVMWSMSHTTTFMFTLLHFVHQCLCYDYLNENVLQ